MLNTLLSPANTPRHNGFARNLATCTNIPRKMSFLQCIYRVAQKSKPPPIFQKIALKIANKIRFFVKLKYESSTIIQSVGNKYSMRDLLL